MSKDSDLQVGAPQQSERQHRVVHCRSDEGAWLSHTSKNERTGCCDHLDVFHNKGPTSEGGRWSSCRLCNCIETHEPGALEHLMREDERAYDRHHIRKLHFGYLMCCCVCILVGAIIGHYVLG